MTKTFSNSDTEQPTSNLESLPNNTDTELPQSYNTELLQGIENLRRKRAAANCAILSNEKAKTKIQNKITALTEKLALVNVSLERDILSQNEYDKTILGTEAAHAKITSSAKVLLELLNRESINLKKK
jgi:uncharacterized protein YfkK (UPF0435 family)